MNAVIRELLADHRRMVRVLRQIRRLVDETGSPGPLPGAALGDCFRYMADYPARVHHPREEAIFELLVSRDTDASVVVGSLHREHQAMDHSNALILELLDGGDGCQASTTRIRPQVTDYITRQIRHMRAEEDIVFPMVEKMLQLSDWKAVMRDRVFAPGDVFFPAGLGLNAGSAGCAIPGAEVAPASLP